MATQLNFKTIGAVAVASIALLFVLSVTARKELPAPPDGAGRTPAQPEPNAASQAAASTSNLSESDRRLLASLVLEVHKTPTCGCCQKWVDHMKASGFTVVTTDHEDVTPMKRQLGVTDNLASCHTSRIGGYVVEGHVPAADVLRLLKEKPASVVGLAAPGMPIGSPGMESTMPEKYDVLSFDKAGSTKVYAKHGPGSSGR